MLAVPETLLQAVAYMEEETEQQVIDKLVCGMPLPVCFRWEDDGPHDVEIVDYH